MPSKRISLITRKRYDRMARLYDFLEWPIEHFRFASWRARLKNCINGSHALEVGVGTGKNLPYYPENLNITAIDLSPRMLARARAKAERIESKVNLIEMDIQQLNFPNQYFDTIFATFVFCSVADPVAGLQELRRVCKPDGRLFLLEHVQPGNAVLGRIFDFFNPVVDDLYDLLQMGCNLKREEIFCSPVEGAGIETGEDFVEWIDEKMVAAQLVILFVTPNYFASRFCVAEMGAAWALKKDIFPLTIPGMPRDAGAVLLGKQTAVVEPTGLDELRDKELNGR
ncbi:MAG: methyltransferase domain-containing protein [Planctomycetota bacterium]|jgi:ubiquinone/menaquinone biosynthesis C-methylase UbiE